MGYLRRAAACHIQAVSCLHRLQCRLRHLNAGPRLCPIPSCAITRIKIGLPLGQQAEFIRRSRWYDIGTCRRLMNASVFLSRCERLARTPSPLSGNGPTHKVRPRYIECFTERNRHHEGAFGAGKYSFSQPAHKSRPPPAWCRKSGRY